MDFEDDDLEMVNEIFFESSPKKEFKNDEERSAFQHKYLDYYKIYHPHLFWIANDGEKTIGYICGVPDIRKEKPLLKLMPYLRVFKELYRVFPAQLHINMHSDARGKGYGGQLLQKFEEVLVEQEIKGMHIITSPNARNRHFYEKNCFLFEEQRNFNGTDFLFMGKKL